MENKEKIELQLDEFNAYGNAFDVSERKELIGEMLRALRQATNLTQSELANLIGIKPVTYSTYENGTREAPAEIVVRLSLLYGIPTDVILQQTRFSRDDYDAQKQIDFIDKQLDELRNMITDKESELNPQFTQLMQAMTDAFTKMSEQISEINENNNDE